MRYLITIVFFFCFIISQAQEKIILNNKFKIGAMSNHLIYCGLAEGDELSFDFKLEKGKALNEFQIIGYPDNVIYSDFKTTQSSSTISINKKGIYLFRFKNLGIKMRVCSIVIKRKPKDESTIDFNTTVYWKTVYDTTYKTVIENYIDHIDTVAETIIEKTTKVNSQLNSNGSKTSFNFSLPKYTISWSYYIGVDQEGKKRFEEASSNFSKKVAPLAARIPGYGPLASLALTGVSSFSVASKGEDVEYYLVNGQENRDNWYIGNQFASYSKGKVINSFAKKNPLPGNYFFCFYNNNSLTAIQVYSKIVAITATPVIKQREIQKMKIKDRKIGYLKE